MQDRNAWMVAVDRARAASADNSVELSLFVGNAG